MDKILVINKVKGITSYDVVKDIKKKYNTKKVGHCGTLDPMATGVMVIAINKALKIVQFINQDDKVYIAKLKLGAQYDTGDITGKIIKESKVITLDVEEVKKYFSSLVGKQLQIPPMYSAIKIKGKKLYEYAREGISIKVEPREIEIYEIDLLEIKDDTIEFKIKVSKGTYIRTICEKIANNFAMVGAMSELKRIKSGIFSLDKNEYNISEVLDYPIIEATEQMMKMVKYGQKMKIKNDGIYQIHYKKELISVCKVENGNFKYLRTLIGV